MCRELLKNIVQHLVTFASKPKEIKGRQITEWFNVGEDVFEGFYKLGIAIEWNLSTAKKYSELSEIAEEIRKNQDWLQTFISIYPTIRIDLDGAFPAADICKIRSGIEFLLRQFVNIDSSFDEVLKNLEELGELDEFDRHLKAWTETGHRPEFFQGDQHSSIPQFHWWWF